jgi:hypothetical protein
MLAGTVPAHQRATPDTSDSNPPLRSRPTAPPPPRPARDRKENHIRRPRGEPRPYSRRAGTGEQTTTTPTTGVEQDLATHRHTLDPAERPRLPLHNSRQIAGNLNYPRENYSGTLPHHLRPTSPPEGLGSGRISEISSLATVDGEGKEKGVLGLFGGLPNSFFLSPGMLPALCLK